MNDDCKVQNVATPDEVTCNIYADAQAVHKNIKLNKVLVTS